MRTALLCFLMLLIALPFTAGAGLPASAEPDLVVANVIAMNADHDCCPEGAALEASHAVHAMDEAACHPLQDACSDSSGAPCDHCGSCEDHCAPAGVPVLAPATGAPLPDGDVLFAFLMIPSGCAECPQRPPAVNS